MENIFRIELNLYAIIVSVIVLWLFYKQIKIKSKENKVFLILVYITMVELVLDSFFWLLDGRVFDGGRMLNIAVNTLYYFFQIYVCYVWMRYCELRLEIKEVIIRRWLLSTAFAAGVILLVFNLWTGCIFTVNERNVYQRSWGFWGSIEAVCCLIYPLYCILFVLYQMISGDRKKRRDGAYLLLVSLVPIISTAAQLLFYGLNFIWASMAMAMLLVLVELEIKQYLQKESLKERRIAQQEVELADSRTKIMLSQIQPHFLYNALNTIQYLCEIDPEKASKTIESFAKYLRGNMDSLTYREPIPFLQEMEHVKQYLQIETLRFEDVNILYDIQVTDFSLPALTIQPLVENAIKYGVASKENGGMVIISTWDDHENWYVRVEDNGVGFDPWQVQYDGRSHIGIENTRNRLKIMCSGEMTINTRAGEGTSVMLMIPKELYSDTSGCGFGAL